VTFQQTTNIMNINIFLKRGGTNKIEKKNE
jgi:hypothetical protein